MSKGWRGAPAVALALFLMLGGGYSSALAHIPEVSEIGQVSSVCMRKAQVLIIEAAITKGLAAAKETFVALVSSGIGCYVFETPTPVRVLAVQLFLTADGIELYSVQVEPETMEPGYKARSWGWFSTHFPQLKGESI